TQTSDKNQGGDAGQRHTPPNSRESEARPVGLPARARCVMRLHLKYGRNPLVRVALGLVFFAVATRGAARRPAVNAVESSGPNFTPAVAPSSGDSAVFTPASTPVGGLIDGNISALSSLAPPPSVSQEPAEDGAGPSGCPTGMALVEGD